MSILNKLKNRTRWLISYPKDWLCRIQYGVPKVKSIDETIDEVLKSHASISRFGDGEFDLICGRSIPFQDYDDRLAEKMKIILRLSDDRYLVALPYVFRGQDVYTDKAKRYYQNYWRNHRKEIYNCLDFNKTYYCSGITRPYIDFVDKRKSSQYFEYLKKIWNGKKVLIVEGEKSRLGVGNDLFDNCEEIKRILCPATNAFSYYQEIIDAVGSADTSWQILIALGPTATVLAYDLYRQGYQALDIGHVDIEYEWMRMGTLEKVPIPYKYTNEAESMGGLIVSDINNQEYNNQILCRVGC